MRCLALAQAFQDNGGEVVFSQHAPPPALESRLTEEGIRVARVLAEPGSAGDAEQTATLARDCGARWVVVDGYHFSGEYQKRIKGSGLKLLAIDDYGHAGHYWADLVLNQNLQADHSLYRSRAAYTELLLGPRFALLRREFLRWRGWKRDVPDVARRLLITLGGADPDNITRKVIWALPHVQGALLQALVVIGGSNPHSRELRAEFRDQEPRITFISDVKNMSDLMAWADLAFAAAGATSWELAFLGLPSLMFVLAENQEPTARMLAESGLCRNLGWGYRADSESIGQALARLVHDRGDRLRMAQRGPQVVQGDGAVLVLHGMTKLARAQVTNGE
jgi:UDP-2,4-diacetamido-2,4,6-trideoxy-beta-L-altropyranose hydrolase